MRTNRTKTRLRPACQPLEARHMLNAGPVFSELLANNERGLEDFDDNRSDWIELANPTDDPIDLAGFYLSDDPQDLRRWQFPAGTTIDGNGYLLVFASGKDFVAPNGERHTNFRLSADGEYVALVEPDGQTVVSQWVFPRQFEDISYGIASPAQPGELLFFGVPTPGAANGPGQPDVAPPPAFSVPGGPFTDAFALELTTSIPDAEIHFTVDGSRPSTDSPRYAPSQPIAVTDSVQVRALVTAAGYVPSRSVSKTYLRLAPDVVNFTSPLPIVVLENFDQLQFPTTSLTGTYWAMFEPHSEIGRASLDNPPDLQTRAGVRLRGSSTLAFPKKSYRLEAWDEADDDKDVSPSGLPEESDWILNGRYRFDRSLMRNAFIYELSNQTGQYAARTRFVEVFVNIDGGPLSADDYKGVYTLMENVKRDDNRVDIDELSKNYASEPHISGGYIIKIDPETPDETTFVAAGQLWEYVEPQPSEFGLPVRQPQKDYLQNYLEDVAASLDNAHPESGYPSFIDVGSWIDHHLLNVLAKNPDAFRKSAYLYKPRNGLLHFGPIWDFDRTMGNDDDPRALDPEGWEPGNPYHFTGTSNAPATFWWKTLLEAADFRQQYIDRYQQLREGAWSDQNLAAIVDALAGELTVEAAERNFERWSLAAPNSGDPPNWIGEVEHLGQWLERRVAWIDEQLVPMPTVHSTNAAADAAETNPMVTLGLPEGAPEGTRIFYTLDGTDPRTPSRLLELPDDWAILRDFGATRDGTFLVDVPSGTYDVTIRQGDRFEARDEMQLIVEDSDLGTVTTEAGQYATNTYRVAVTDDQMMLVVRDQGGATPQAVVNGLEIRRVEPAVDLAFDFGPEDAPVATDFVAVGSDRFTAESGYGWTNGTLNLVDRGEPDALRGDLAAIASENATFAVDLPNGRYQVTVVMGDANRVRDQMELQIEPRESSEVVEVLTAETNDFEERTYLVTVSDGQLRLQLSDLGGQTGRAVINGLIVSSNLRFDFGTDVSPIEFRTTQVRDAQSYTDSLGYGWSASEVESFDRTADVAYGGLSPSAIPYGGETIEITGPATLRARAFLPNSQRQFVLASQSIDWSGLRQLDFDVLPPRLAITEINYNPADPTPAELGIEAGFAAQDFEFIELQNVGGGPLSLTGYAFVDGIDFSFSDAVLAGGEYGVLVRNPDAFRARYGEGPNIVGQYSARLSNGGERLELSDPDGNTLFAFEYDDEDPWSLGTDGDGATLELIDPAGTPAQQYAKYYRWRHSTEFHGSPGRAGLGAVGVVINEVLTRDHANGENADAIELFNTTNTSIDMGGWYLSDSAGDFLKFPIPEKTTLAAGQYLVVGRNSFSSSPDDLILNNLNLSGTQGGRVWLVQAEATGELTRLVDAVQFGAAVTGESFGRAPNGTGRLVPMQVVTMGGANSVPRVGPVVLSEFQYHAPLPSPDALALDPQLEANDLEFVEVTNTAPVQIDIGGWQLAGGIDMTFAAGMTLGPAETIVLVPFDPNMPENLLRTAAFREHYGIDVAVHLAGGYARSLDDDGEKIVLLRPDADAPTSGVRVLADETVYDDLPPWPAAADGTGQSLHRSGARSAGHFARSWDARAASPGHADLVFGGDADGDGDVDFDDIDDMLLAVQNREVYEEQFGISALLAADVNHDGRLDQEDLSQFVAELRRRK